MTPAHDALDRLAPAPQWEPDWSDVLRRAGVRRQTRALTRRRLVVAVLVLVAVVIPLAAVAAANDWWFLRFGNAPRPLHEPVVVREGSWSGHAWRLIAYPSGTDGLCVSVTPKDSPDTGAMGCGPLRGVARTADTKDTPDMTITYLAGFGGGLPPYIVGPVIEEATSVEIRFVNGDTVRLPTFAGPPPLEHVRFYTTELARSVRVERLAGLGRSGKVVACLVPLEAKDGISPLSACRRR